MKQIISKDGRVVCTATDPYPPEIIRQMKKAGYKVKEIDDAGSNQADQTTTGRKGRKRKGTDPVGE